MEQQRPMAAVTGGGSGIGAATVATLARDGFRIACLDRDGMAAKRIAKNAGLEYLALTVDVADEPAMIATTSASKPWCRSAAPQEIAESIAWLLSPRASYVNGATLAIYGGLAMH